MIDTNPMMAASGLLSSRRPPPRNARHIAMRVMKVSATAMVAATDEMRMSRFLT